MRLSGHWRAPVENELVRYPQLYRVGFVHAVRRLTEAAMAPYSEAIDTVLRRPCSAACRVMGKPPGGMSIRDAAWQVMVDVYHAASGGGRFPANAPRVMYAARKPILELTGRTKLDNRISIVRLNLATIL